MKYTIQLASVEGASSWLYALPLSKHDFDLTKTDFRDRIAIRYTWEAKSTPVISPCGKEKNLASPIRYMAPMAGIRTYDTTKSETCLQT